MTEIIVGTVKCQKGGCFEPATLKMNFKGTGLFYGCFNHADEFMRGIAVENMKSGGTHAQTVDGYMRWRADVGKPVKKEEVLEWLKPL